MQQAVNDILEAAKQTGLFAYVNDEVFDENEQYPALIVTERRRKLKELASTAQVYFSEWDYTVVIMVEKEAGYEKLETAVQEFLKALFQRNISNSVYFQFQSELQYEAYVSDYDVLVSRLSIVATTKTAFL